MKEPKEIHIATIPIMEVNKQPMQESKMTIDTVEENINIILAPLKAKGYSILIQDWMDGWLLHLYLENGSKHITTIGADTLEKAVWKAIEYHNKNKKA